jgi:RIO kinase 2
MKLDPTIMRTMNRSDFRVLAAVEQGMTKHELVPLPLITSMANLRHGGTHKIISSLLRDKLLSHDRSCGYDGYRLTNAGYDILALHHLKQQKILGALGTRIGTGKESDVYLGK